MINILKKAFEIKEVKKKIVYTLLMIVIYRFLANIPVAGIDTAQLQALFSNSDNSVLNLLNLFSGGGLQQLSIIAMGIYPYINASIIIQLLSVTKTVPHLEELSKEGAFGRLKLNQYTQWLTLPICILSSYSMYFLLSSQGLINALSPLQLLIFLATQVAGTFLLMWIGNLITNNGVGQGVSIIILAGILNGLGRMFTNNSLFNFTSSKELTEGIIIVILVIAILYFVVKVSEAVRKITIQRAMRSFNGGESISKSFLPLKINQSGVMPIIFAMVLVNIPAQAGAFLTQYYPEGRMYEIGTFFYQYFQPFSLVFNILLFFLVFAFTFFYTQLAHSPEQLADNLKKSGNYIPGIRPGKDTEKYLKAISLRLNLIGGIFLGFVSIVPSIIAYFFTGGGNTLITIGGTGILIVVSVALETIRQIESLIITKDYELVK